MEKKAKGGNLLSCLPQFHFQSAFPADGEVGKMVPRSGEPPLVGEFHPESNYQVDQPSMTSHPAQSAKSLMCGAGWPPNLNQLPIAWIGSY